MIPVPYILCLVTFPDDDSDAPDLHPLVWGYDTAAQASADRKMVCKEEGHREDDVMVIRWIDLEDAEQFTD